MTLISGVSQKISGFSATQHVEGNSLNSETQRPQVAVEGTKKKIPPKLFELRSSEHLFGPARLIISNTSSRQPEAPPPAKKKRGESSPIDVLFTAIKELERDPFDELKKDIMGKFGKWYNEISSCYDPWKWVLQRVVIAQNICSFKRAVVKADSPKKLDHVLEKYRTALLAKRILMRNKTENKKLEEGVAMVDSFRKVAQKIYQQK